MEKEIWIRGDRLLLLFDLLHLLTFPQDPENASSVPPHQLSWQKCRLWVKRRFGIQPDHFAHDWTILRPFLQRLAGFFRANQRALEHTTLAAEYLLAFRGLNVGPFRDLAKTIAADDFEDPGKMPDLYDVRQGPQFARLDNDSL